MNTDFLAFAYGKVGYKDFYLCLSAFICGEIKLLYFSIDNLMKITSVLGFDYGKKRIGIATGQTITSTATPCKTVNQIDGNPDWTAIQAEIQQWKPQALIVGMPYHTDGSENKMTAAARQFCYELEKRFKLPVIEVDEALSSQQAEEILRRPAGMREVRPLTKKHGQEQFFRQTIKINQHNKHEIDKMAAAIIVQRWLNLQSTQT